jgi:hypothetical protein
MYGGMAVEIHVFFSSEREVGEWLVSRSCFFTPGDTSFGTNWAPRSVSMVWGEKCYFYRESNSDSLDF